jgi:hypothetical protein
MESGSVTEIVISDEPKLSTYLGNVINIASRIESETKNHSETNLIIGDDIYKLIENKFYKNNIDELRNRKKKKKNEKDPEKIILELSNKNRGLLLSYLTKHNLKGVNKLALYKLSKSLIEQEMKCPKVIIELAKLIDQEAFFKDKFYSAINYK